MINPKPKTTANNGFNLLKLIKNYPYSCFYVNSLFSPSHISLFVFEHPEMSSRIMKYSNNCYNVFKQMEHLLTKFTHIVNLTLIVNKHTHKIDI
jgi:hypothetical protein